MKFTAEGSLKFFHLYHDHAWAVFGTEQTRIYEIFSFTYHTLEAFIFKNFANLKKLIMDTMWWDKQI